MLNIYIYIAYMCLNIKLFLFCDYIKTKNMFLYMINLNNFIFNFKYCKQYLNKK